MTAAAARAAFAAAADRADRADRAWKEATDEATAARKAYREARKALDDALAAEEFNRTHPALFGDCGGELPEPDFCCDSAETITAWLTANAPAMTDAEIDALPRPVQAEARAIRARCHVTGTK